MTYRIYSYDNNSKSANMLKESLGAMFLKHKGSTFIPKPGDVVINWGSSNDKPCKMLNSKVWTGIDKLTFFKTLESKGLGGCIPPFWTSHLDIPAAEYPVVCRTQLQGCDGAGIVIAEKPSEVVAAKLITKYIPKDEEYRVHVVKEKDGTYNVICVQRKGKKNGSTNKDFKIRTTGNDYVFVHSGFKTPDVVMNVARKVFKSLDMDFGGLDVIYVAATNRAYVLEVNSAPELGGISCAAYTKFFQSLHTAAQEDNEAHEIFVAVKPAAGVGANVGDGTEYGVGPGAKSLANPAVGMGTNDSTMEKPLGTKGAAAVVSGGDIAGLMANLEAEIAKKVETAFIKGKASVVVPVVDVEAIKKAAYMEGIKTGEAALKAKMKELFA